MSRSSAFVLTTINILFRSMPNGNFFFKSESLSLAGDNSLGLHLNATYYAQYLALKSVYEKKVIHNGWFPLGQCLN